MTQVPLYDALAVDYDRFVNWKGRLAHELPFLERLFQKHGIRQVLDSACGTGHHAIALALRGYDVIGADLSAAMVGQARDNAAASGVDVPFAVAGLSQLSDLEARFDAVLCLGNSLPHLPGMAAVEDALIDFAAVLRPGGLLVIQNRNFDRLWALRERFMEPQSYQDGLGEWLFLRFYDFHGETISFNMIRLRRMVEGWTQEVQSTELYPIFHNSLAAALEKAGFVDLLFYGGCDGSSFDLDRSEDLIAVAQLDS